MTVCTNRLLRSKKGFFGLRTLARFWTLILRFPEKSCSCRSTLSCQQAEDVNSNPTRTRFLIYQPQPIRSRVKPEIKTISLAFKETFIKKKLSFTHPQSHQLRTAIFIQCVLFDVLHQSQKPCHSLRISIFLWRPARLKLDSFSKSKREPGPNRT